MAETNPPAFQFYADDFLAGTMDLTPDEVGAYIRLLCAQWSRGYIAPDPARIDRIAGCPVPPIVLAKFDQGEDGNLRNARLEREREKQKEYRSGRSDAGKKGAAKRWQKNGSAIAKPLPSYSSANGCAIDLPLANGMANDSSPSPSPSPSPSLTPSTTATTTEPQQSQQDSRRPRTQTKPKDLRECLAVADRIGLSAGEATAWYNDQDAAGWRDRHGMVYGNWIKVLTTHRDILRDKRARFGADKISTPGTMDKAMAKARKELDRL